MNEKAINEEPNQAPKTGTEIIADIDKKTPLQLFGNGQAMEVYKQIEAVIKPMVFDINTEKGRKEIGSVDRKVAGAKRKLDDIAKIYVAELEAQVRPIKAMRKDVNAKFEALQAEIKRPLVEIKEKIAAEKLEAETKIRSFSGLGDPIQNGSELSVSELESKRDQLAAIDITTEEFGEYVGDALKAKEVAESALKNSLQAATTLAKNIQLEEDNRRLREQMASKQTEEQPKSASDLMEQHFPESRKNDPEEHASGNRNQDNPTYEQDNSSKESGLDEKGMRRDALNTLVSMGFDEAMCKQFIGAIHGGHIPFIKMSYAR